MSERKRIYPYRDLTVLIVDPESEFCGKRFPLSMMYHGPPDRYYFEILKGKSRGVLESQIDIEDFRAQELAYEMLLLNGCGVGDWVNFIEPASGKQIADFKWLRPHRITKIDYTGWVEFDEGCAEFYRPWVEKFNPGSYVRGCL